VEKALGVVVKEISSLLASASRCRAMGLSILTNKIRSGCPRCGPILLPWIVIFKVLLLVRASTGGLADPAFLVQKSDDHVFILSAFA
jgi:hypothetical protein